MFAFESYRAIAARVCAETSCEIIFIIIDTIIVHSVLRSTCCCFHPSTIRTEVLQTDELAL